jgi:hypothetical protein
MMTRDREDLKKACGGASRDRFAIAPDAAL